MTIVDDIPRADMGLPLPDEAQFFIQELEPLLNAASCRLRVDWRAASLATKQKRLLVPV